MEPGHWPRRERVLMSNLLSTFWSQRSCGRPGYHCLQKSDSDAGDESDTNSTDGWSTRRAGKQQEGFYGSCEEEYPNAVYRPISRVCTALMFRHSVSQLEKLLQRLRKRTSSISRCMVWRNNRSLQCPSSKGLEQYELKNASHLISDKSKSTNKTGTEFI